MLTAGVTVCKCSLFTDKHRQSSLHSTVSQTFSFSQCQLN